MRTRKKQSPSWEGNEGSHLAGLHSPDRHKQETVDTATRALICGLLGLALQPKGGLCSQRWSWGVGPHPASSCTPGETWASGSRCSPLTPHPPPSMDPPPFLSFLSLLPMSPLSLSHCCFLVSFFLLFLPPLHFFCSHPPPGPPAGSFPPSFSSFWVCSYSRGGPILRA